MTDLACTRYSVGWTTIPTIQPCWNKLSLNLWQLAVHDEKELVAYIRLRSGAMKNEN